MKFIFYQNILSIHQSAFLRNLAEKYSVTLVVPKQLDEQRIGQGWSIPDFGKTEIIVNPAETELNQLLGRKDDVHIFSGINAYILPAKAFKIAVKNKLKIGIILEPFNWIGWKGKLRFLKYFILKLKYNRHINFILAIGNRGRWCYEKTGFSKSKIFDWGYFTEIHSLKIPKKVENQLPRIIFVGRLDKNKNILPLISICKSIRNKIDKLAIIGDGTLKDTVKLQIQNTGFEYSGILFNKNVQQKINESDLLVLPSISKDGWGAVVNEALMCGTPVIASDNCGSSVLLKENRGCVFSIENNNLEQVLCNFLQELPYNAEQRKEIREWALQNISGEAAATYFDEIVQNVFGEKTEQPVAPWLKLHSRQNF